MEFTVGSAIRFGWETFKKRPWFFVGTTVVIAIIYIAIGIVSAVVDEIFGGSLDEATIPGQIVSSLLGALLGMGVTAFYLAAHDNSETAELSLLWHPRPFWKFLGTSILASLAIIIGFVLLVVPGIIAMVLFMFSTFIVIDKGLGPIEAMKESMRITAGHRWPLLGLIVVLSLIGMVGALALGVGLLVAIPVATLAFTHAYRVLSGYDGQTAVPVDARLAA